MIILYFQAVEIEGLKIFHYSGGINFATRNIFRDNLYKLVGINPQKEVIYRNKLEQISRLVSQPFNMFGYNNIAH